MVFLKQKSKDYIKLLIFGFVFLLAAAGVIYVTRTTGENARAQGLNIAEKSVVSAAVQCYALEGAYPANMEYLENHYGVSINKELYFIDYRYMGTNIMPEIYAMHVRQNLDDLLER